MNAVSQFPSLNLTNYQNQAENLPMGPCEEPLTSLTDKICTLREYSKPGVVFGIAMKCISISNEYSSMLIAASSLLYLGTTVFASTLEKKVKSDLAQARQHKADGFSKYPSNRTEFTALQQRIIQHIEDGKVASKVNELLDVLFNHSFAQPKVEEIDEQLSVELKASEQYKLVKREEEETLYIPKITKLKISKDGIITFGKTYDELKPCCDSFVPYVIKIPSNLVKLNYYWSEVHIKSDGALTVTGPINFGLFFEQGGKTPMRSHYQISQIS